MPETTLRKRDLWKECLRVYRLPENIKPQGADESKWIFKVIVRKEWVESDPLMFQMMHDKCLDYETESVHELGRELIEFFTALKQFHHDIAWRDMYLKTMSDKAQKIIPKYASEASKSCGKLVQAHAETIKSYKLYKVKEGFVFITKGVSAAVSGVSSGVSIAVGGVPGAVAGALGFTGVLKNVIQLTNQICDWAAKAEKLQIEINRMIPKLQQEQRESGNTVSKALVTGKEYLKGVIEEIDPLQLGRLLFPSITNLKILVEMYKSKIDGIDIRSHALASSIYVLMDSLNKFRKNNESDKVKIRYSKPLPMNLVGLLGKGLDHIMYNKNQQAMNDWKFMRNHVLTVQQRKYFTMEKRLDKLIKHTLQFVQRVQKGRKAHDKYEEQLAELEKLKWEGTDLAAKITAFLAWELPQIVTFNALDIHETVSKIAKDPSEWVEGVKSAYSLSADLLKPIGEAGTELIEKKLDKKIAKK